MTKTIVSGKPTEIHIEKSICETCFGKCVTFGFLIFEDIAVRCKTCKGYGWVTKKVMK